MSAASGGEPLNVEDVFATHLYRRKGYTYTINNGIALDNGPDGTIGSSTSFDGSNDYLYKSSDLTGNSDGKTFTFSFWLYPTPNNANGRYVYHTSGSWRNTIRWDPSGRIFVAFYANNSSGGTTFEIQSPDRLMPRDRWSHCVFSADMTDSNKRHLYINDIEASPSWTYNNSNVDFTVSAHAIGEDLTGGAGNFYGNIAHFFFDRTYRDLSVESTRRLFIDSAKGATSESTLSALNPLIYIPMTSGNSIGQNLGTGGNFSGVGSPSIDTTNGAEALAKDQVGGLVWTKKRTGTKSHFLVDTERGAHNRLQSDTSNANDFAHNSVDAFGPNGYSVGQRDDVNDAYANFASWTFRKAPKFFDIQTWTGNGTAGRTISHNLGSTPGCVIIKRTDGTQNWEVYHRGTSSGKKLILNSNAAEGNGSDITAVSDTTITLSNSYTVNGATNANYVAYIFAHNNGDGDFGPTGDKDIIKCGSYTGNGSSSGPFVDLGFEPQWLLIKPANISGDWLMFDNMRGMSSDQLGKNMFFWANSSQIEYDFYGGWYVQSAFNTRPTGFELTSSNQALNANGFTYTYIAIRRGPMAAPTDANDVFDIFQGYSGNTDRDNTPAFQNNILCDLGVYKRNNAAESWWTSHRLTQEEMLRLDTDNGQSGDGNAEFDWMEGWGDYTSIGSEYYSFAWKRAPGFFDITTHKGNSTNRTITHNLGAVPEMIWVKQRDNGGGNWWCYHKDLGNTKAIARNTTSAPVTNSVFWNNTSPTDTTFSLGTYANVNDGNNGGASYISYLFGSVDGVSKVGSFTYSGSPVNVDCGFSNGAQFVMLKGISGSQSWLVFNSVSGIVAGNDPYMEFNGDYAEDSNYDVIDPYSAGFTAAGSLPTGTIIFYAIAA